MVDLKWKGIAELIGVGAIVASLIFVGLQMQQAEDIARYERYGDSTNPLDLTALLLENEDVWLKGCAGEPLEVEDWFTFIQLADLHTIRRNSRWEISRLIRTEPGMRADGAIYMLALDLYSNPGLLRAWNERESIGRHLGDIVRKADPTRPVPVIPAFNAEVRAALEVIRANPPEVLTDGPRCGLR
jgi:hypothetical protein